MHAPFDRWFTRDIGHGVRLSDPSFNLSERVFSGLQRLSIVLTVVSVYSQRPFRGTLFPPGSRLPSLSVDLW